MRCRNCGYDYSEMTNFCPYCGADQRPLVGRPGNSSLRFEPERPPINNVPGKPPRKKRHTLRTIGIIIVVLLLVGNIGNLRRGSRARGIVESSSENTSGQGLSESVDDTAAKKAESSGAAGTDLSSLHDSSEAFVSEEAAASSDDAAVPSAQESSANDPDSTDSIADPALVTPEFKEMMDSYEAWFDTYIEFMTKYKKSQNPADMMLQYAEFLAEYADMIEKMDAVDEEELSAADLAYYMEVTARIYRKLAAVQ